MKHFRATRAVIDGAAIIHNFQVLSAQLQRGDLMPVVKADAYGHGAVNVAHQLASYAKGFAVALVEEGIALRKAGISADIVVLEGVYAQDALEACYEYSLIPVIHCQEQITQYASLSPNQRPACWLKFDIGMHRLGFVESEAELAWHTLNALSPTPPILCGHFSCADDPSSPSTPEQLERFLALKTQLACKGSLANSPAITLWPQSHVDWNRAGIAVYGVAASSHDKQSPLLKPAMTLTAPVIAMRTLAAGETVGYGDSWKAQRTTRLATIAIGYADGFPRHAPSGTPVWVGGQRAFLAGRVSMDMITVDVTDCDAVNIGDTAELWGSQLPVEEIALHCNTIAYELVTRVGPRVPRVFKQA